MMFDSKGQLFNQREDYIKGWMVFPEEADTSHSSFQELLSLPIETIVNSLPSKEEHIRLLNVALCGYRMDVLFQMATECGLMQNIIENAIDRLAPIALIDHHDPIPRKRNSLLAAHLIVLKSIRSKLQRRQAAIATNIESCIAFLNAVKSQLGETCQRIENQFDLDEMQEGTHRDAFIRLNVYRDISNKILSISDDSIEDIDDSQLEGRHTLDI